MKANITVWKDGKRDELASQLVNARIDELGKMLRTPIAKNSKGIK